MLSPYLLVVLLSWLVAQGAKYLGYSIKYRTLSNYRQLYRSGSMPSAHAATVVSLLTVVGLEDGIESGLFGLASVFALIVMYDSMMVRHASGTQGAAIHALINEQKSKVPLPRIAKGHTPAEVVVGAVLGLILGLIVFLATN